MTEREKWREKVAEILSKSQPIIFYLHDIKDCTWTQISDICVLSNNQLQKLREYDGSNWKPYIVTVRHCYERLCAYLKDNRCFKDFERWNKINVNTVRSRAD